MWCMKQTTVKLIEYTTNDLASLLKSYQMEMITDAVIDYKNKHKKLTPLCVANLMMIARNGFRSEEFYNFIEEYSIPFIAANTRDELIRELYNNPYVFIDPCIIDGDEPFIVKVDDIFLDQNRILTQI